VTSLQGTTGRPRADGQPITANFDVRSLPFIDRNAGVGNDFFSLTLRGSRSFVVKDGVRVEGLVEVFNVTNRVNNVTRNTNWGAGAYPTNPSATFNQITAVGDPRIVQLGVRLVF
jgi:hypothetical protein